MLTRPLEEFVLAGELYEDTQSWALLKSKPALFSLLHSVPVLAFSPTGARNVARRFQITESQLEGCIVAVLSENLQQSRAQWAAADGEVVTRTTPEVLEVIRKAVTAKPRRKSAAKPKKVGEGRANG